MQMCDDFVIQSRQLFFGLRSQEFYKHQSGFIAHGYTLLEDCALFTTILHDCTCTSPLEI